MERENNNEILLESVTANRQQQKEEDKKWTNDWQKTNNRKWRKLSQESIRLLIFYLFFSSVEIS